MMLVISGFCVDTLRSSIPARCVSQVKQQIMIFFSNLVFFFGAAAESCKVAVQNMTSLCIQNILYVTSLIAQNSVASMLKLNKYELFFEFSDII